jgi:glyoxylase-like metal-dependent hydrolase (beta-lactamase superfamily II)
MIKIYTYTCNSFMENAYLLVDSESLEAALIDPGCSREAEWGPIARQIRDLKCTLRYVLLTHGHVDHIMGTGYATRDFPVEVWGSHDEEQRMPSASRQALLFQIPMEGQPDSIRHDLRQGDVLQLGSEEIRVIDVPGHSFHGLIYYLPASGVVFTGDVLFAGGVGRSDFGSALGCDGRALAEGIVDRLLTLPPETKVYPGHGPSTTIGFESATNPYI